MKTYLKMYILKLNSKLRKSKNAVTVFTFHRFHNEPLLLNYLDLSISVSNFLYFIQKHLTELQTGKEIITFDDGYKDILLIIPILKKYNIKPIVFFNMNNVLNKELNWWDYTRFMTENNFNIDIDILNKKLRHPGNLKEYDNNLQLCKDYFCKTPSSMLFYEKNRLLNELEIMDLVRDDLIILGNHFYKHVKTSILNKAEYNHFFKINQDIISNLFNIKVRHLAFPYGLSRDIRLIYKIKSDDIFYYSNYPGYNNSGLQFNKMIYRFNANEYNIKLI